MTTTKTTRAQLDARRDQLVSDLCQLHLDELGASLSGDDAGAAEAGELMTTVQAELAEIEAALAQRDEEPEPAPTPAPEEERLSELDRQAFAAWLAAKDSGEIVGRGTSLSKCPLATYLTETQRPPEGAWIEVNYLTWDVISARSLEPRDLPAWAMKFVEAIDHAYPATPIPAAAAKDILAKAIPEGKPRS
ncbi:MAG TPA: hypothetical protein VE338_22225 [Ktedonobacterales bacterium]|jgi:hypothetical protein|nr:hypothetical protein [Ktedonobacterales bacterium]